MISAAIPHNEAKRLDALREYQVLDTPPEPNFDELTELVAEVLDVPIALVSLIDENRQWFKSHHGLDATETPREIAFCAHAILDKKLFVIEDSHDDERFKDNPLVTSDPDVRFYAGMPLITREGFKIGTVCGIDHKPRVLTKSQIRILDIVSRQVVDQLELRKNIIARDNLFTQQSLALNSLESANQEIRDFVSVVAHDLRAPVLNASGFSDEILSGTSELKALLNQSKDDIPSELSNALHEIIDEDLVNSATHIRKSAQIMSERIDVITQVAKHGRRELKPEMIDLEVLLANVWSEHDMDIKKGGGEIEIDKLPQLYIDKVSVQLVLENLVSNAVKYKSPDRLMKIRITAKEAPGGIVIIVEDNGRGISAEDISRIFVMFRRVGLQDIEGDGTGLAFSRSIVNRLGGQIWCESTPGQGSSFHVFLPSTIQEPPM